MSDGGVVVTGGSRGLGAAIAVELAARGVTVAAISRSGDLPSGTVAGEQLASYACDVTDAVGVRAAFEDFAERADGIRGLVNNAGIIHASPAVEADPEELLRMFHVNAVSGLIAAQAAYPYLARGGGVIIGIGSFFERFGIRDYIAYSASKAAIASMNRTLAVEWARDGIRVLTVAPGYVETDLNREELSDPKVKGWLEKRIPVGRVGQPNEVGRFVATLLLESPAFLTGETIYLDGGHGVRL